MTTITQPRFPVTSTPQRSATRSLAVHPAQQPRVRPVRAVDPVHAPSRIRAIITGRNITIILLAFSTMFIGRLFISVVNDSTQYAIVEKTQERDNLVRDAEFIEEQLNVLNSPQHLSTVAQKMGMISNSRPAYLRVSDGKVWGDPHVQSTETIDRTAIANSLESTLISLPASTGVATKPSTKPEAESNSTSTPNSTPVVVSTGGGIPAPNTH